MEPLPYLGELLSLKFKSVRESKALLICLNTAYLDKYGWFRYRETYASYYNSSASTYISCVFGSFLNNWNTYREKTRFHDVYEKNGIEILGAQPNATGTTYSKKCRITVKELKEACKMNGIKIKGDKKILLHALMKI